MACFETNVAQQNVSFVLLYCVRLHAVTMLRSVSEGAHRHSFSPANLVFSPISPRVSPSKDLMVALKAGRYEVVATSYDLLRACVDRLKKQRFDAVIFDEYHTIKSATTRVSQAACELRTKRVFGLTGTLIQVGVCIHVNTCRSR